MARILRGWPVGLVAVCVLVPLAVDPWGLRPFAPPKDAVLVVGAALTAFLAAIAWVAGAAPATLRRSPGDPWLMALGLLVWSWTVTAPMLTVTSAELHMLGAVRFTAVVALAALAIAAAGLDPRWRHRIGGALVATSVLMMVHALLQASGRDPFELLVGGPVQAAGRWRAFATTGNPNWTGAYLAATAPLVARVVHQTSRANVLAGLFVWSFFAAAVVATGSRLALIALIVGALAWRWGCRHPVAPGGRRYRTAALTMFVALATIVPLWILFGDGLLARWQDMGSVFGRLVQFRSAAVLIAGSPLTGHGLDHFQILLPEGLRQIVPGLDPAWQEWVPRTLTAHVHNDFLETAVEAGIICAVLLAVLWLSAVRCALRRPRFRAAGGDGVGGGQPPVDGGYAVARIPLEPALAACLMTLAVLALGSTPLQTPSTVLLFWVVLALVATGPEASAARQPPPRGEVDEAVAARPGVAAICVLSGVAVVAVSIWYGASLVHGNRLAAQARAVLAAEQYTEGEDLYRRLLHRNPWDHESGMLLAAVLVARGESSEALEVLDRAERWSASRDAWLVRAEALRIAGRLEEAAEVLEGAVRAVPDFLRAHFALGNLRVALGQEVAAAGAYRRILASSQDSPLAVALKSQAREKLVEIAAATGLPDETPGR